MEEEILDTTPRSDTGEKSIVTDYTRASAAPEHDRSVPERGRSEPSTVAGDQTIGIDPALLGTVSARAGSVFLKLFIPPRFYGDYLVFLPDGEPVGLVSQEAARLLKEARGRTMAELVAGPDGAPDVGRVSTATALLEAGLLIVGNDREPDVHWIEPDQTTGTRHSGIGADLFIRFFYDYFGSVFYEGSPLIDSHGDFLSTLSRYFPQDSGKVCLDAGSGSGYYASALALRGHQVYACDISKTRLAASSAQPQHPGRIEPVECNLDDIPLPDSSIDFAMCNFVLEHVADPYSVTEELIRLLRPGGHILLAVPSFNVRDHLAVWFYGEVPSLNFEHLRSYGLIPKTHPWCEPILDTLTHLREKDVEVQIVEGANILTGLWEPWAGALHTVASQCGAAFSTTWPWNCLGQQTVIYGIKKA
jgi:SAM-dependent methyltransferase